jgi:hypothetical protein
MTADTREVLRRLDRLEAENRDLRRMLGNIPDRIPTPPPPPRLKVDHDHDDDVHGTPVFETDIRKPAYLEDQWKLITSARAKSSTDTTDNKLAQSIAQVGGHDEGFVWGEVAYQWGTDGWRSGSYDEYGWGLFSDVIGIEKEGFKYVNLMCWARWSNGLDDEDRKIGPIFFDSFEDNWKEPANDNWILGKMIFDGVWWRPGYQGTNIIDKSQTAYATTPWSLDPEHDDHCPIFRDPQKYVKLESFEVWAVTDGQKVNVHDVAACNRDDINEIWRHLAVLDWHTADVMGWHDNWLDKMWSAASGAIITSWLTAAYNLLVCLQAIHAPTCNTQMAALTSAQTNYLNADGAGYQPKCPRTGGTPGTPQAGDYHNDSRLHCPQIEGS